MTTFRKALLGAVALTWLGAPAFATETVKIAFIDPLSGGAASTGENGLKHYQYLAEYLNAKQSDYKFEVVGYDNKMNALLTAIQEAKSTDPKKFAPKLEQTKMEAFNGGEAFMRADDHQFFQPMYISSIGPLEPGMPFDAENTGWGWKLIGKVDAKDTIVPTTCKMNRPS